MAWEERLTQLLVSGLANGAIYALLGLGLVLMYTTTRTVNVAVGEFATFGALLTVSLLSAGLSLLASVLVSLAAVAALGAAFYTVAIEPARRRGADVLRLMIVTIAVHLVLEGVALIFWGTSGYALPPFTPGPPVRLGLAVLDRQRIWILVASAAALLLLWAFFRGSLLGRALRASAVNPLGARLVGIPVARMGVVAFTIAGAFGALSGALVTPVTLATYDMGFMLGLKGFVGAAIGGLTDYPLTVLGCLFLGVVESLAAGFLPSGYRDAVAFVVLIAVLLWRALPLLRHGVLVSEQAAQD
ncbi:MAG: branched-chain amino acid ABC transporter permease [Clostridia bacterium]|nr:branched-chain amino acid ABC transporter permease [Clostridia bacterium]